MSKRVANPEKLEELDSKIGTVPSGQTVEGQISSLNGKIANIGIKSHFRTSFAWGSSLEITREENKGVIIICGRNRNGNIVYVIPNTNEFIALSDTNSGALASVSVTSTKITLTSNSSGYGSTLTVEVFNL